jgi:2-polyprenyl-3-methyl-5-hydroxy-6-metoxy-1,4-benzoquinol methylase
MTSTQYRQRFYESYVSAFKSASLGDVDYAFSDSKLVPLLADWVAPLPRDSSCVDLGCGAGNILHALGSLGFTNLYGVDASEEQIALARRVAPQAQVGLMLPFLDAFPDEHFALITLFDVLEHLTKDEILAVMQSVARKLKRSGIVIAHTPNGDSPFVGSVQYGDFTHETLLTPSSARHLCAVVGLDEFEAREHLGASATLRGRFRERAWRVCRRVLCAVNAIETGSAGSGVLTRNFCFKAEKSSRPMLSPAPGPR